MPFNCQQDYAKPTESDFMQLSEREVMHKQEEDLLIFGVDRDHFL